MSDHRRSIKRVEETVALFVGEIERLGYYVARRENSKVSKGSVYLFICREGDPREMKVRISNHDAPRFAKFQPVPSHYDISVGRPGPRWWDVGATLAKDVGKGPTPAMIFAAHEFKRGGGKPNTVPA